MEIAGRAVQHPIGEALCARQTVPATPESVTMA
jgi:hypothetical protein